MAQTDENQDERTETASTFRREEFRRMGQVAVSREALSVCLLFFTGVAFYFSGGHLLSGFRALIESSVQFSPALDFDKNSFLLLCRKIATSWFSMYLPIALTAVVAGLIGGVIQVGFHFTTEPLTPNWNRINPIEGFSKLFSWNGTIEAIKAILKVALVAWLTWVFLRGRASDVGNFFSQGVETTTVLTFQWALKLFLTIVGTLILLAGMDYGFQRFQLEKRMKMTRKEVKEEYKLREGDPYIKARIKTIQRRIASRRMMEAVPKADVVVTNPTHFAVALQYAPGEMAAPKVVAKGAGVIALKIKELAYQNRIPVVENKPLARTLFKEIEIGHYIPKELYKAVAEVLAYVYRLKGRVNATAASAA